MGIVVPKGAAVALHLSPEYRQGLLAGVAHFLDRGPPPRNPFDYFDAYSMHYAWEIGFQAAAARLRERRLSAGEVRRALQEGEEEGLRRLGLRPP